VREGSQGVSNTPQAAPPPPGMAWWVFLSSSGPRGPPSGISSFLTWKKSREDFRDEAPPSRGGTWAGALLPSGGQIPPGNFPPGGGNHRHHHHQPLSHLGGSYLNQPLQQHHLISNHSSSLVSDLCLKNSDWYLWVSSSVDYSL
jgi:hypothetical protein